jgi:hypothetical protein
MVTASRKYNVLYSLLIQSYYFFEKEIAKVRKLIYPELSIDEQEKVKKICSGYNDLSFSFC